MVRPRRSFFRHDETALLSETSRSLLQGLKNFFLGHRDSPPNPKQSGPSQEADGGAPVIYYRATGTRQEANASLQRGSKTF